MTELPIATQWVANATTLIGRAVAFAAPMIVVVPTSSKGSGWLVSDRFVVTNEHVIRGGSASDIRISFADGLVSGVRTIPLVDNDLDLAVLELDTPSAAQPLKIDVIVPSVSDVVHAWGFPLGYNGPAPLLSVGYLAGFEQRPGTTGSPPRRRLVINGALNPGNSGGPIVSPTSGAVLGVAVTKHAPIPQNIRETLDFLMTNQEGMYASGQKRSQSQSTADVLMYLRSMMQVVIGEAIPSEDVAKALSAAGIGWQST